MKTMTPTEIRAALKRARDVYGRVRLDRDTAIWIRLVKADVRLMLQNHESGAPIAAFTGDSEPRSLWIGVPS